MKQYVVLENLIPLHYYKKNIPDLFNLVMSNLYVGLIQKDLNK